MKHLNNNKKNNTTIVTSAAKVFSLATILIVAIVGTITPPSTALGAKFRGEGGDGEGFTTRGDFDAPAVVSGENVYIAWWTNNTVDGNEEVMFRASSDGGATFSDKVNLSNTTEADSWNVQIAGEGENVIVSWWETNQTSDIPVARVSNDAGETFGPMLRLAANGTISATEEGGAEAAAAAEGGEGETVEEEAVGGEEVAE